MPLAATDAPSTYTDFVTSDDWLCRVCARPRFEHCNPVDVIYFDHYSGQRNPMRMWEDGDRLGHRFERMTAEFVAMLRIKNEVRWIREVLEALLPLCDRLFVLDDHSTDGTAEICAAVPRTTVLQSPFVGLNESRDKNWLYDQIVRECKPEWILCIDGDEVLEKRGPQIVRDTCKDFPDCNAFALKIAFLWNDPRTVRVDRIYDDFWRPSIFRPYFDQPMVPDSRKLLSEFRFMSTPFGRKRGNDQPNLHCSSIPQRFIHQNRICPARLKHYGYMERAWRVKKLDYYTSIDWLNRSEDCYRHMTQGDNVGLYELPRVQQMLAEGTLQPGDAYFLIDAPPTASLVHAGPLRLAPWDEETKWTPSDWALHRRHG